MISRPWYAILPDYELMGNKDSQNILHYIMIWSIYLWFPQHPYFNQRRLFKERNCTAGGPEITPWLPCLQEQETKQKTVRNTLTVWNVEGTTRAGHWSCEESFAARIHSNKHCSVPGKRPLIESRLKATEMFLILQRMEHTLLDQLLSAYSQW